MNKTIAVCVGVMAVALFSGCTTTNRTPLIFGQTQTVGLSASSSTADQGAEFTLGYRDRNIAVMPVLVCAEGIYEASEGKKTTYCKETPALATARADDSQDKGAEDAFSVIGQFELTSTTSAGAQGASVSAEVGLGKFFATGLAAQELAKGFAKALEEKAKSGSGGGQ